MTKAWQQLRSAMTCGRTLELKCSNLCTGATYSELNFSQRHNPSRTVFAARDGSIVCALAVRGSLARRENAYVRTLRLCVKSRCVPAGYSKMRVLVAACSSEVRGVHPV